MTFLVKITKGELDFCSPHNLARWKDFKKVNEGKYLRIEKPKKVRSLKQNAAYWLYLEMIERETGNEAQDLHAFFSSKFLPNKMVKIHGKNNEFDFERKTSTTELTKIEFGEYMDKISAYTQIAIPDTKAWLLENGYIPN